MVEWKELSSRLMWVEVKFGSELWVFVSAYGLGSGMYVIEKEAFWNDLDDCLQFWSECEHCIVRKSKCS